VTDDSEAPPECPVHGSRGAPAALVGRRLVELVGAWHWYGDERRDLPDIWLIDDRDRAVRCATGSDWCLIVG